MVCGNGDGKRKAIFELSKIIEKWHSTALNILRSGKLESRLSVLPFETRQRSTPNQCPVNTRKEGRVTKNVLVMTEHETYKVFGHDENGKGLILEIVAQDAAEALNQARLLKPKCRFSHVNLK